MVIPQFTAVPGVKSIYQYSADEPNPFEFVKPDDEWIDEKCVRRAPAVPPARRRGARSGAAR